MKKKQQKTQLILISAGIILILLTYFYYPYINMDKPSKDLSVQKDRGNVIDKTKLKILLQVSNLKYNQYNSLYLK